MSFERFSGGCSFLASVVGFLYALSFVVLRSDVVTALSLLLGGLLSSSALVALYGRLRGTDAGYALWGVLLGLVGDGGAVIHGGYDLANALHPPTNPNLDLPSQIDPRGLLTFGVTGLGLFVLAALIVRGGALPKTLGYLGFILAVLLIVLYLGRLIILEPSHPFVLVPALVTGFVLNPAWYLWLGTVFWRAQRAR